MKSMRAIKVANGFSWGYKRGELIFLWGYEGQELTFMRAKTVSIMGKLRWACVYIYV